MNTDRREAQPVTKESFLAFVGQKLDRGLTDREKRGFDKLFLGYSVEDIQGYFFEVLVDVQERELSLEDYLRGRKRTVYGLIKTLISDDESKIEDANQQIRHSERDFMWQREEEGEVD